MQSEMITTDLMYLFFLIMARYLGIFLITPIFGSRVISNRVKISLSFVMSIITFLLLYKSTNIYVPNKDLEIIIYIIKELSIGVFMGFVIYIFFSAIQLAGQFIDLRMGFRIGNVVDPLSGASSPIIGQFLNIFTVLVFMAIDGHLIVIKSLNSSFDLIPPGKIIVNNQLWQYLFRKGADIFLIGFKIALPIIGTLFIVDVILGFLARSVPQMNIFIVGLPLKILIGFILMILAFQILIYFFTDIINNGLGELFNVIQLISPG